MYKINEVIEASKEYFDGDELAANVFATKYAMKDKNGSFMELTPTDMHHRLSKEFARIETKFGGDNALNEAEIFTQLDHFKYIVPQGSPMMGIGNDYIKMSLSNCVVVASPKDTMSSILEAGKMLANLYKARAGVGIDISTLRPDGAFVNNAAGTSSGAWSFADFFSYITRMVGQFGRRGALMISMDVRHPDIEKFITMKHDKTKVTGANVSVKISDDFMKAVERDDDFTLKFPVDSNDPKFSRIVKARDIWNKIVDSATKTAEPGLLMWDNILKNLPAENYADVGFKTVCVNPCAEIALSEYDSCRLISINLKHFVKNKFTPKATFDYNNFKKATSIAMRLSDDLVELEIEKLNNILKSCDTPEEISLWTNLLKACQRGRRTGLGTHGLADALACLKIKYDSDEALEEVDKIYETLKISAYSESIELSKERGKFEVFDWDKEKDNAFIKQLPLDLQEKNKKYGRRNISILTNAPTGSVAVESQSSSGMEPVFRNLHIRRKKLNHNESDTKVDFIDEVGDKWQEFKVFHQNVKEYLELNDLNQNAKLPDFFVESDNINWNRRIEIQAAIQKHIDHSISSTINLPKGTTPEVVGELYLKGWKCGLKGITVYVDGSRSGVLISDNTKSTAKFEYHDALKRPQELECNIHHATIKGEKWTILIGLMDGKPYEVFGGLSDCLEIPKQYSVGKICKHASSTKLKSRYDLFFGEDGVVKDITKVFNNVANQVHTRMISLALRHGTNPEFLASQLQKDADNDLTSFSKVIARVLKKYIKDGTKVSGEKICGSCNQEALIYVDGCVQCSSCGWSRCG